MPGVADAAAVRDAAVAAAAAAAAVAAFTLWLRGEGDRKKGMEVGMPPSLGDILGDE